MQPRTHRYFIRQAVERTAAPWLEDHLGDLLRGNDDEDVYIVPLIGWRWPSLGFTHTYRPGSRRGELGAPSAKRRCLEFLERAHRVRPTAPTVAAWWLGRACHLLADMAVPARTRGVWHLLGDPLETWVEENLDTLPRDASRPAPGSPPAAPEQIMDSLAALSSGYRADTTRMPLRALLYRGFSVGIRVPPAEAEIQARELVPRAMEHTAALLDWFVRSS
jgi:hypothetical protein